MLADRIEIFNEFRRLSQILALYNREKLQDSPDRRRNICNAFVFSILLIMLALLLLSSIWNCFDYNFAIIESAFSISVCFIVLQLWSVYISMAVDNREILQTVEDLQEVIDKRQISATGNVIN